MRNLGRALVFLAVACPFSVSAQGQKPNLAPFAGTWIMQVAASDLSPTDGAAAPQATLVISENTKGLRVQTIREGKDLVVIYPFHEVRPTGTSGGGDRAGTLRWEDGTLVTVTPYTVNGMTLTREEHRSLSADGREMTVVSTVVVQHGYEAGPNASAPIKEVFRRAQ